MTEEMAAVFIGSSLRLGMPLMLAAMDNRMDNARALAEGIRRYCAKETIDLVRPRARWSLRTPDIDGPSCNAECRVRK